MAIIESCPDCSRSNRKMAHNRVTVGLLHCRGSVDLTRMLPTEVTQSVRIGGQAPSSFEQHHLRDLVAIGGRALQEEDQFIRNAVLSRPELQIWHGNRLARFGIRRIENERFYQYLIWRALLKEFVFPVDMEREGNHDFVAWDGTGPEARIVAVGEMKRWVSSSGEVELPGIVRDIQKIKERPYPGFILITTAYQAGQLGGQINFLSKKLRVPESVMCHSTFLCSDGSASDSVEFALIGFMAADSSNAR